MLLKKIICCPIAILIELFSIFFLPIPIIILGLLRCIAPGKKLKALLTQGIETSALTWVSINHFIFHYLLPSHIEIIGANQIVAKKNYLAIANHQSWMDILMLEEALYKRTGFSRYFIKKNLLHTPLSGWACRVLYYPSMHRLTKNQLAKHPERRNKDIATTKRACHRLKGIHFKLNNFPEGTRFSKEKHAKQDQRFQYLLQPKTGGIAHALNILSDHLDSILDLTIVFSQKPNVIQFFLGKSYTIKIIIKQIPITSDLIGDYEQDPAYRVHMQHFISSLWQKKEALIHDSEDYRKKTT